MESRSLDYFQHADARTTHARRQKHELLTGDNLHPKRDISLRLHAWLSSLVLCPEVDHGYPVQIHVIQLPTCLTSWRIRRESTHCKSRSLGPAHQIPRQHPRNSFPSRYTLRSRVVSPVLHADCPGWRQHISFRTSHNGGQICRSREWRQTGRQWSGLHPLPRLLGALLPASRRISGLAKNADRPPDSPGFSSH